MGVSSKPWTTTEMQQAREAYRIGGSAAVQAILPHRTVTAIQGQAQKHGWTLIAYFHGRDTVSRRALEIARAGSITAPDLAADLSKPIKNASAVLSSMHRRGILVREWIGGMFVYTPAPEFAA